MVKSSNGVSRSPTVDWKHKWSLRRSAFRRCKHRRLCRCNNGVLELLWIFRIISWNCFANLNQVFFVGIVDVANKIVSKCRSRQHNCLVINFLICFRKFAEDFEYCEVLFFCVDDLFFLSKAVMSFMSDGVDWCSLFGISFDAHCFVGVFVWKMEL